MLVFHWISLTCIWCKGLLFMRWKTPYDSRERTRTKWTSSVDKWSDTFSFIWQYRYTIQIIKAWFVTRVQQFALLASTPIVLLTATVNIIRTTCNLDAGRMKLMGQLNGFVYHHRQGNSDYLDCEDNNKAPALTAAHLCWWAAMSTMLTHIGGSKQTFEQC